jgi:hypothetical protein
LNVQIISGRGGNIFFERSPGREFDHESLIQLFELGRIFAWENSCRGIATMFEGAPRLSLKLRMIALNVNQSALFVCPNFRSSEQLACESAAELEQPAAV